MNEDFKCRICLLDGNPPNERLLCPCSCTFEQGSIHITCLRKWRYQMLSSDPSIVSFYCDDCKAKFPPRIFEDKTNLWERPRPKPHPDEGAIAQFHEACSASFALFLFDFDALKPSSFMGFLIQAFLLQYCLKPETSERTTFSGDAMSTGVRFLFAVQILGWATGLFPDYMTDSLVGHKIPIIIGVLRMISTLCFVIGLSGYIFVGIDPILHRRAVNDTESSE